MERTHVATLTALLAWVGIALLAGQPQGLEQPTPEQQVVALKQSLQKSQASIRTYEWIETTIISHKGEEKSRKVMRCYYGADGKVEKLPVNDGSAQPQPQQASGRRGGRLKERIVENKKDEMKDYMERAAALVHQYVPPSPDRIQKTKDAGKLAVRPGAQGQVGLEFSDYLLPGDKLTIQVDAAASRLLGLGVASYLDTPQDVVALDVRMGALADGTSFAEQTTLDAKAKNIRVVIQNAGYRPTSR
jgi:hypothetical protein